MEATIESWRPVAGWEALYEVSDHGRARSLDRLTTGRDGRTCHYRGRILKQSPDPDGYLLVGLSRDGRSVTHAVHRLVAEAFIGPRPDGLEVLHRDGNPANNRPENLRYGTHIENMDDMLVHGRRNDRHGSANHNAKLSDADVKAMRAGRAAGETLSSLARRFGVGTSTVHRAVTGSTYNQGTPSGLPERSI
jgi:HNH endonuclease/NUMOD4 motif-containing protein